MQGDPNIAVPTLPTTNAGLEPMQHMSNCFASRLESSPGSRRIPTTLEKGPSRNSRESTRKGNKLGMITLQHKERPREAPSSAHSGFSRSRKIDAKTMLATKKCMGCQLSSFLFINLPSHLI